ncbi:hypothetical protein PPYR_03389 [Photinus pyralis]|uniref:Uncharacterized protein n=2 Tax=Photinus pyralis TaxID=7054 RepID=A0A5N4A2T7_PHOPY|nr:ABC transporter G family member 23-like isoform X1 [Photinus pyralis]KAB0791589.1 hypothetical protein PPYR_03389 [Photinus pyralis]
MFGDLLENSTTEGVFSALVNKVRDWSLQTNNGGNEIDVSHGVGSAVAVEGAFKRYGRVQVLHDLSMDVPKGSIYGLLGASGCGKTTLLGCIVGIKRLDSGNVYVFGERAGGRNESRIGYMPQATGLYGEFTVTETLRFFGRVIGMDEAKIDERSRYLVDLLALPPHEGSVANLSGGQQRRVSLAVALLHEPELLILDEPTVGVDCTLRELIWEHFKSLTGNGGVTIIITTHYIEEARQANRVGIMRGGCLMAESAPAVLMKRHQAETLERVFLALSVEQNQAKRTVGIAARADRPKATGRWPIERGHMKALVWKNALWLRKNLTVLAVVTLLPVVMVSVFCLAIGHSPFDLTVAVVNQEVGFRNCNSTLVCGSEEASCAFLGYLEERGLVMRYFESEGDAIASVMKGETYASIVIRRNYSRGLHVRAYDWQGLSVSELAGSSIDVFRDLSNKHLAIHLQITLYQTFQQFFYDYIESCGRRWEAMKVPVQWEAVYGSMNPNFTDFSIPGVLLSIIFIIGVILTAYAMLIERNEASLERTLAMGVTKVELLTAHIVIEYAIMSTQIVLAMLCAFLVFGMTIEGSLLLSTLLLMLAGFCGISYGLVISCVSNSPIIIALAAMGSYFAIVLTGGLIWPIEAMHWLLKPFALFFPLTKSTESLRHIMHKGWGLFDGDVYVGFLSVITWSLVLLSFSVVLIKFQKN